MLVTGAALWLVPWIGYLAASLPDRYDTHQWRLAWVGFDIGLLACFAAAAWLGRRRHPAAIPVLAATAALMCCDAWFDVMLDWTTPDWLGSLLMAVLVELPLAGYLLIRARILLVGGMASRPMTAADLDVHTDPTCQRVLAELGRAPATAAELTEATGTDRATIDATLHRLATTDRIRPAGHDRWRNAPLDLRQPDLSGASRAERARYERWLDAKLDQELELFARAFRHPARSGPWAKGSRAGVRLTEAELARFSEEYLALINRYALLHDGPDPDTQEVAVRLYAFPRHLLDPPGGAQLTAKSSAS